MKSIIRLIIFGLMALALLTGCGGTSTNDAASSEVAHSGMFPLPELSQINSTGQPQFINVYANW